MRTLGEAEDLRALDAPAPAGVEAGLVVKPGLEDRTWETTRRWRKNTSTVDADRRRSTCSPTRACGTE